MLLAIIDFGGQVEPPAIYNQRACFKHSSAVRIVQMREADKIIGEIDYVGLVKYKFFYQLNIIEDECCFRAIGN
ncbi:hypothetical protein ES703_89973 [subsurface metagenome]